MKALIIDIDRCNGCYNCQISCKDEHVANDWSPYAKPQPNVGQFWMKVTDVVQGSIPKVRVRYMLNLCQHCDNAPCINACNSNAINKRDDGIVIIDPENCAGGKQCMDACPYDAIYFNADLNIAQKCTMCAHLLDDDWKEPRCVDACPTSALKFVDADEPGNLPDGTEQLHPEFGTKPRVFYKGLLNRYFIAGAVYDPEEDICLEGCEVTLTNPEGDKNKLTTDDFGDFWFEKQDPGEYSLLIEAEGYVSRELLGIKADKDINVGDIELYRKTG